MKLYLLRHGDSLADSPDDASRPLSQAGERQARLAGRLLRLRAGDLNLIFCSPLLRARQTALLAHESASSAEMIVTEHLTPTSDHRNLFKDLNSHPAQTVLCVGHEPHLSALVSLLISSSRAASVSVRKGSLAKIDVSQPVGPGTGVLEWILPPDIIEMMTKSG